MTAILKCKILFTVTQRSLFYVLWDVQGFCDEKICRRTSLNPFISYYDLANLIEGILEGHQFWDLFHGYSTNPP